jgi:hypothetical protein
MGAVETVVVDARNRGQKLSLCGRGRCKELLEMHAQIERPPRRKAFAPIWRVYNQWGVNKAYVGLVEAPDEVTALQRAIRMFHIVNPDHQKHLVVEPRTL